MKKYGRIFVLGEHAFSIIDRVLKHYSQGFKAHGMLSRQNDFSINTHEFVDF